jgi:hypothetical protein
MYIHTVCAALERENISYAVVGGFAVALHGIIRGTLDVDIAVQWTLANLEKLEQTLKGLGLVPKLPIDTSQLFHNREDFINNRNLIAWNFYDPKHPQHLVDVIINYPLDPSHIKSVQTPSGKIKVLGIKQLIAMKRASGRPQDLIDIEALEKL